MSEGVLRNAEGEPIYNWRSVDNGIEFQFEYFERFEGEGDFESIFTMPHSECYKVYAKYEIDPSIPIEVAIHQISESGSGAEFKKDLLTEIQRVNTFSWLSFRPVPLKNAPLKNAPLIDVLSKVKDAPVAKRTFRSY